MTRPITHVRRQDAFAVTLEAAGGSPDGKPHGPVLCVGKLTL